tara:strand:+ start:96 stop:569 length:474 start_codon:yes stop_codon:yes gene_type:complete
MIIECPNCNKKFNIDENLIHEKGRLLKCSSCDHIWHYNRPTKNESQSNKNIDKKEIIINEVNNIQTKVKSELTNKYELDNEDENLKNKKPKSKVKKKTDYNILSLLIVFLISFITIIFLIDTFKLQIANFFPDIITILDNLYATLHDLILFFKDLFN